MPKDNQQIRKGKIAKFDHDHSMLYVIYSVMFDIWLHHELSSLPYRAISLITSGPRDRCYWIQCEPDNTRAELLITFVLNVKGTDAVCVSTCERVSWV